MFDAKYDKLTETSFCMLKVDAWYDLNFGLMQIKENTNIVKIIIFNKHTDLFSMKIFGKAWFVRTSPFFRYLSLSFNVNVRV